MEAKLIDINEFEYEYLKKLHKCVKYTRLEVVFMQEFADKVLEEKIRCCTNCETSIGEFKQKLFSWFIANQSKIEEQIQAERQVELYTKKD